MAGVFILFCLYTCREGLCTDEENENEGDTVSKEIDGDTVSKENDLSPPHPYYFKNVVQNSNSNPAQRRKSCYV